eukprot:m.63215 g.63215  ORF g.63215 m.63215 type:complete len:201 (-) comp8140_c0_seq1:126-728(-)
MQVKHVTVVDECKPSVAVKRSNSVEKVLAAFVPPPPRELAPWRPMIHAEDISALVYRWSSWMYSVVGAVIILQAIKLTPCFPEFPFTTFGCSLVVQGGASYMNDVVTWGLVGSLWKPFDRVLATINTVTAGVMVGHHHVGLASFPPVFSSIVSVALAVALYCKWRSSSALHANDCHGYMWWHSGWHYSLPLAASFALMII